MHRSDLSPLFITFLGLLSGAALVSSLYCIARTLLHQSLPPRQPNESQMPPTNQDESIASTTISSSSEAHLITVFKYSEEKKEETCVVCLSEFTEGEEVRRLSECTHAYHVPCIDMWLRSHPNCPICRVKTASLSQHSIVSVENFDGVTTPELPRLPFFGI